MEHVQGAEVLSKCQGHCCAGDYGGAEMVQSRCREQRGAKVAQRWCRGAEVQICRFADLRTCRHADMKALG